jgi:membrane peptidoglycan carboxypeptidase
MEAIAFYFAAMTPPRKTIRHQITQVFQQTRANFSPLALKANARVPEILVQDADAPQPDKHVLLGDRYVLGRSSKGCDIIVNNPVVSTTHLSITRDPKRRRQFILRDEGSTNGIYRGKKRISKITLRHGDEFTLGPPELQAAVTLTFQDPPPWYLQVIRYGFYGTSVFAAAGLGLVLWEVNKAPTVSLIPDSSGPVGVFSDGLEEPLRQLRTQSHVDLTKIEDFAPSLPKALIASEDSRFYWHVGVDPWGIARSLVVARSAGRFTQGASTLTQQMARSLFRGYVGTEDSLARKVREAAVSLKLETFYSKDQILLFYLNRVFLGADTYGFEDAAKYYFAKSAKELTLSEAATLVGILPAPNIFRPCAGSDNDKAITRRNLVLDRMLETGAASAAEIREARRSILNVNPEACKAVTNTKAPFAYDYVFQELQLILGEELAKEGNFIVETGLNLKMQAQAETALKSHIASNGGSLGFSQGSVVTLDTSTGLVKAMVGGTDYSKSQFNRATAAQRQPGSTFKLFAYGAALEQGISASKSYSCDPMTWQGRTFIGCNHGASGAADMYQGMALSENIIALRVGRDAGLDRTIALAQRMGIKSKLEAVPALILGQSVVNALEITGSYAAVANRGIWNPPRVIKRVYDSSYCTDRNDYRTCREMYAFDKSNQRNIKVLTPNVADTLNALLRGVLGGTGKDAALGRNEAGKTGTTDKNVDMWFIGYVPSEKLITGVWLGNDNNSASGGSSAQAAQVWGKYMRNVVK